MRRGLTLGKFAPFHRGHQLLIATALAEVDELVVMVYFTDLIDVPLQVRAAWIQELYPTVRIIESWDGPDGYGDTPEIRSEQETYILKKLSGLRITHFYSSEFYGDHVSRALGAVDRRVDEARTIVPISGTSLRADYFAGRAYIEENAYADLITKVCFMGAPSTGKTSLASAMAAHHNTAHMPEYGAVSARSRRIPGPYSKYCSENPPRTAISRHSEVHPPPTPYRLRAPRRLQRSAAARRTARRPDVPSQTISGSTRDRL